MVHGFLVFVAIVVYGQVCYWVGFFNGRRTRR